MARDSGSLHILDQIERGQLSVEEALRRLEGPDAGNAVTVGRWQPGGWWWAIPLVGGVVLTATGAWMVVLGGWWWLGAVPALVLGVALMTAGAISRSGRWLEG